MPETSALFLHGAGGGGWEWRVWAEVWRAHGIRVHAPDLQPVAAGIAATRFDDYTAQVADVWAALPRPRALVGASLGGWLAAQAADAVDALILINPLPPAPWNAELPAREWPDVVRWRRDARLSGTRAAMPGADAASALYAFRRWRDESGAVLRTAQAGVRMDPPTCRTLLMASTDDADVPDAVTRALAHAWGADFIEVEGGHVDPLLGRTAAANARLAVEWLNRPAQAV